MSVFKFLAKATLAIVLSAGTTGAHAEVTTIVTTYEGYISGGANLGQSFKAVYTTNYDWDAFHLNERSPYETGVAGGRSGGSIIGSPAYTRTEYFVNDNLFEIGGRLYSNDFVDAQSIHSSSVLFEGFPNPLEKTILDNSFYSEGADFLSNPYFPSPFSYLVRPGDIVTGSYTPWNGPSSTLLTTCVTVGARSCVAAVPEPSSWALALLGLGAIGGLLRVGRAVTDSPRRSRRLKWQPRSSHVAACTGASHSRISD